MALGVFIVFPQLKVLSIDIIGYNISALGPLSCTKKGIARGLKVISVHGFS